MGCQFGISYVGGRGVGVDGNGGRKVVRQGSVVTKISDIQQTHLTTPILMVTNITNSHGDY